MLSLLPLFVAIGEGKKSGLLGALIGIGVGITVGAICLFGLWACLIWLPRILKLDDSIFPPRWPRYLGGYAVAVLGLVNVGASCYVAWIATKNAIRLLL